MNYVLLFVGTVLATSIAWYFILRNNRKHIDEILNLPETYLGHIDLWKRDVELAIQRLEAKINSLEEEAKVEVQKVLSYLKSLLGL
jgi:hypothetical protein